MKKRHKHVRGAYFVLGSRYVVGIHVAGSYTVCTEVLRISLSWVRMCSYTRPQEVGGLKQPPRILDVASSELAEEYRHIRSSYQQLLGPVSTYVSLKEIMVVIPSGIGHAKYVYVRVPMVMICFVTPSRQTCRT